MARHYIARVATCSNKCVPHVVPIYFANDAHAIFFATERETVKFRNISELGSASIVVDEFYAEWASGGRRTRTKESAVVVTGRAQLFESGTEYMRMYRSLFRKYPDYREENWQPGESPIVRVYADRLVSWGI